MKISTVAKVAIIALVGYMGYGYAVLHLNRAAMVYKDFAKEVARGDMDKARTNAFDNAALTPFNYTNVRRRDLQQGAIKMSYFKINSLYYSEDGEKATIDAIHTVRVDPPGSSSSFGTVSVSFPEHVQMEQKNGAWKVKYFEDNYTANKGG